MSRLNNINWGSITLYHGTTKNFWDSIINKGFKIPDKETNWLGRGMYFGVNNIITPIKYAFEKCKGSNNDDQPIILKRKPLI